MSEAILGDLDHWGEGFPPLFLERISLEARIARRVRCPTDDIQGRLGVVALIPAFDTRRPSDRFAHVELGPVPAQLQR
jgi:hypothetical protein